MPTELTRIETADGVFLDASITSPQTPSSLRVDAVVLLHGTGSNYTAPGVLETFAKCAVEQGIAVLRLNTRGHDGICSLPTRRGMIKGGATYEHVADCTFDVRAGVECLVTRGHKAVALVGHSMGGVKAIYSQARDPHPAVKAIVGISPPRFCHERFLHHATGEKFREEYSRAGELVARGQPDVLLHVTQPMPFVATAAGYLEKYGPEDRYDFFKCLPGMTAPVLILIGGDSMKTSAAFCGTPDDLRRLSLPHVTLEVIEGASITYRGYDQIPFERAAAWLTSLPEQGLRT